MGSCTLEDRIIQYVRTGNYKMIQALYGIGFLESYDIFDLEGSGKHDGYLILEIVARYPISNYKEMIDIMLINGLKVDCGYIQSFLETALIYKNFPTAAYLKLKGGTFRKEEVDKYNEISDINIYTGLDYEYNKLIQEDSPIVYSFIQ